MPCIFQNNWDKQKNNQSKTEFFKQIIDFVLFFVTQKRITVDA